MESECHLVVLHHMPHFASLEVLAQQWAIHRVGSLLDDFLGGLHGILETQVGHTLVGDDDVGTVDSVIDVCAHGHNSRDAVVFLY